MADTRGTIVNLFAGSNTARGFFSFYDNVASGSSRVLIIKGGPGTGKSTLMRRIGLALVDLGWPTEFFYCSSDSASLDAIHCPGLGVTIIDGTAPHVVEPPNPGAVGEVINLGEFWDRAQIHVHRKNIHSINTRLEQLYRMSHDCLAAASAARRVVTTLNLRGGELDTTRLRATGIRIAQDIASVDPSDSITTPQPGPPTGPRTLFASAITERGPVSSLETAVGHFPYRQIITGPIGSGRSLVLSSVLQAGLLLGLRMVVFRCTLDPERIEHVLVPDRGAAVITAGWPHELDREETDRVTDTASCVSPGLLVEATSMRSVLDRRMRDWIDSASGFLARAKELHDLLESYYTPTVDFSEVDRVMDGLLGQILDDAP